MHFNSPANFVYSQPLFDKSHEVRSGFQANKELL